MRACFFALFAGLCGAVVCGCREAAAPAYDRLRLQLQLDAFEALAAGDADAAARLFERLAATTPVHAFYALAATRARRHAAAQRVNAELVAADLAAARRALADSAAGVPPPGAESALAALTALGAYLDAAPFATAASAEEQLSTVLSHRSALERSRRFQLWLASEHAALARMRFRERGQALRQLRLDYDLAIVTGAAEAELILAQIAVLAPDTPLLRPLPELLAASAAGDVPSLMPALELVACREWCTLPAAARRGVALLTARRRPCSFSGLLLQALLVDVGADVVVGVAAARELAATVPVGPAYVACFLRDAVFPAAQFRAHCWRSPFPSVTELLNRVAQLHEQHTQARHDTASAPDVERD